MKIICIHYIGNNYGYQFLIIIWIGRNQLADGIKFLFGEQCDNNADASGEIKRDSRITFANLEQTAIHTLT